LVEVGDKVVAKALAFAVRLLNHWCSNLANRQPEGADGVDQHLNPYF
jgi:hypothetical protein